MTNIFDQSAVTTAGVCRDHFLIFGSPAIEDAEIQEVLASMASGWLGTGPKVMRFENDFKAYKGAQYAVAVNSCTAALHLSMLAACLEPGDEVITTPLTFCATINAIIHAGATPVLADVNPVTMNIDPIQIEAKIAPKTKAIVPVHFAGRPCDMDAIGEIASRYNLKVIED
ncbi:MAG: aminotransferase class I/II-fold pyridoxal phosphate-dependent enzyme, partial [Fischerella sp.]|nr:aminotransferase class I/II-fold pyridoxal phosphate-dependent enzyme [Fischerella sp.]